MTISFGGSGYRPMDLLTLTQGNDTMQLLVREIATNQTALDQAGAVTRFEILSGSLARVHTPPQEVPVQVPHLQYLETV